MTATMITGPALEPVSLDDVKAHLRIDGTGEDALLTAAIVSARVHVEAATRRALITQAWRIHRDGWPPDRIVPLTVAPLISVDAVTVYDSDGAGSVVDADSYEVDLVSVPGRLVRGAAAAMPVGKAVNGIAIDVTAGYGPSSVDVPGPLRQAILMLVTHWYEHRGAVGHDLTGHVAPLGFDALVAPYRVFSL